VNIMNIDTNTNFRKFCDQHQYLNKYQCDEQYRKQCYAHANYILKCDEHESMTHEQIDAT